MCNNICQIYVKSVFFGCLLDRIITLRRNILKNKLFSLTDMIKLCNDSELFEQLLYQGLTRVRSKLALVICSKEVLSSVLPLLKNS